jgi:hypothetical protein
MGVCQSQADRRSSMIDHELELVGILFAYLILLFITIFLNFLLEIMFSQWK